MSKFKITIDDEELMVEKDTSILDAAKQLGINLPTLCHHEALKDYGACRLCVVEVTKRGRSKIKASCTYPIREKELVVKTMSKKVISARKMILELLLARCPDSEELKDLAQDIGLKQVRFKKEDNDCILCGLCIRTCDELIGVEAISFKNRGPEREVATPFDIQSDVCIGCKACSYVCPVNIIDIEDKDGKRIIYRWNTELELVKCKTCGEYFAPQKLLDYIKNKYVNLPDIFLETCMNCRHKIFGDKLTKTMKLGMSI
jgi:NADH dehydrogenase/NADH:ubiquinone oxidoreductase subunit G